MFLVLSTIKARVMKLEKISSVDRDENFINTDILKAEYMVRKNVFHKPIAP